MCQSTALDSYCLIHQRPEDQMSLEGAVCSLCKQRLYTNPPLGSPRKFWESQPVAYSVSKQPCFVYTRIWDDFEIRSLQPADAEAETLWS